VRLDVLVKDSFNTHYNIEMQAVSQKELGKRSRYYHSQIDMELSEELIRFLRYVKADLEDSTKDFGDGYVSRVQKSEDIIALLESKFSVSEKLRARIIEQTDISMLECWFHNAIKATTVEEFMENM